eukprot:CAMPEP_0204596098 /NCGR_PEP_ID=MMETSP0661-20131031/53050_1 /ASSEMBLY_ACC=CAM_ASM_000606 /TAXON_ID=109239 /ORGANISM="Alexandrium margalefi, Strain AMGDE01CS-322" /LENGTH=44 /DNA_ID= /DNA_START= /DNA_END= /DNA_ORIENTATION=
MAVPEIKTELAEAGQVLLSQHNWKSVDASREGAHDNRPRAGNTP